MKNKSIKILNFFMFCTCNSALCTVHAHPCHGQILTMSDAHSFFPPSVSVNNCVSVANEYNQFSLFVWSRALEGTQTKKGWRVWKIFFFHYLSLFSIGGIYQYFL